jgi:uncharacterized protein
MSDLMTLRRAALLLVGVLIATAGVAGDDKADKAREGMTKRQDLEIVDCLLPGQVRQLGQMTYVSQRRPVRTTAADCRIRGGEYVAYDRADYKSALHVWMAAAQAGDPEAQNNVGEIYERGLGGEPNYEAAVIWYQKAADQGYARAQFNLGTLYEQGLGVPKDRLAALNLYRRAWGLPEDSVIYKSAAEREQQEMRAQLEKVIGEQDQHIDLLNKQLKQAELDAQKQPPATAGGNDSSQEIQGLKAWIAKLESERRASNAQLSALPAQTREPQTSAPTPPLDPRAEARLAKGVDFGRYYALVIGNQNYQMLERLQTPRTDAERAAQVLKEKYGFSVQLVEDANDAAILAALNDLNSVLRPNDNLLIYYAGHGERLTSADRSVGYWLPVNAEPPPRDTYWVPNEQITMHVGRMKAQRVLVVADSCYAGLLSDEPSQNIFGTEGQFSLDYVKYKLPKRSRLVLASGGDEPVLDSGGQGDSVFARAFLDVLNENNGILSSAGLFLEVKERVKAGAARSHITQTPELKAIKAAGHELGDFFFVPRNLGT